MFRRLRAGLGLALALVFAPAVVRAADEAADTLHMEHPPGKYGIVVSATRTPKDPAEVPNAVSIVSGEELRRRGTRTLAQALQDVVGIDTGEGSDNGTRFPNIGMWGLKEFDALLITLDGIPVGGPFNPNLAHVPIEDIERIEFVKGPQGTLYGVSAFAGMIQIFTRDKEEAHWHATAGGGSFGNGHGSLGYQVPLSNDYSLRLGGSYSHAEGWQDRTPSDIGRGSATLLGPLAGGNFTLEVLGLTDHQDWGSPLPFDAGELVPGFELDRNYAIKDAEVEHKMFGAITHYSRPVSSMHKLENTLGFTQDNQRFLRSFPGEIAGDTVTSEGVLLEPKETTVYEDLRLISHFAMAGDHELVSGVALTWGKTTADGKGFDFEQLLSEYPNIPSSSDEPVGDLRSFKDDRTFFGAYLHDSWTLHPRLTLAGGGRYDATHEKLHAQAQEQDGVSPLEVADDEANEGEFSGDISALIRLMPEGTTSKFQTANLYGSWRTSFKPAAPNLTEAEGAEILDPETTHSWEVGLKARFYENFTLNLSSFDMTFNNMVVSILGPTLEPEFTNAGEQRFKGSEVELGYAPPAFPGTSLSLGYAYHDPRFVHFTFVTPDGEFRDVSGNNLELAPKDLIHTKLAFAAPQGPGAFVAIRYQGERFFNRRNTFTTPAYTEWDAGLSFERGPWMLAVIGRNLSDDRHPVTESEIGDSQFYMSPPRNVHAELTLRY
jgi:iron complex outermembrane recepter protein